MPPDKNALIRGVLAHAMAGSWSAALEESRAAVGLFPDDLRLRALAEDVAARCAEAAPPVPFQPASAPAAAPQPWAAPRLEPSAPSPAPTPSPAHAPREALDKAFQDEARRRLERQSASGLGEVVQDSRRISDVLRAATTRHREDDVAGMLEAARAFLAQDLVPEAMRLCQSVLERDPANEHVRSLLVELSRRKGL